MRKLGAALMGSLLFVALTAPASAKTETVKGRLVDLFCYNKDKAHVAIAHEGMDQTCGRDCAMEGQPVGLLTNDGKVYQVTGSFAANKNAKLVPYISQVVELTGDTSGQGGKIAKMRIVARQLKPISK